MLALEDMTCWSMMYVTWSCCPLIGVDMLVLCIVCWTRHVGGRCVCIVYPMSLEVLP